MDGVRVMLIIGPTGTGNRSLLLRLIQLRRGNKHRKLCQPVLCGFITGRDEDLGIEMGILVAGDLMQLEGIFVPVIRDDMNVRRSIRNLGLDTDEATGNVASIEESHHHPPAPTQRRL